MVKTEKITQKIRLSSNLQGEVFVLYIDVHLQTTCLPIKKKHWNTWLFNNIGQWIPVGINLDASMLPAVSFHKCQKKILHAFSWVFQYIFAHSTSDGLLLSLQNRKKVGKPIPQWCPCHNLTMKPAKFLSPYERRRRKMGRREVEELLLCFLFSRQQGQ